LVIAANRKRVPYRRFAVRRGLSMPLRPRSGSRSMPMSMARRTRSSSQSIRSSAKGTRGRVPQYEPRIAPVEVRQYEDVEKFGAGTHRQVHPIAEAAGVEGG
jgi:hypothetical protein